MTTDRAADDEATATRIISILAATHPELLERVPQDMVMSITIETIRQQRRSDDIPPAFRTAFESNG